MHQRCHEGELRRINELKIENEAIWTTCPNCPNLES